MAEGLLIKVTACWHISAIIINRFYGQLTINVPL